MKIIFNFFKKTKFISILVFFFIIISFFSSYYIDENLKQQIYNFIKSYLYSISFSFFGIFFNNLKVALFISFGSILLFLPTFILGYLNFFIIGIVFFDFIKQNNLSAFLISILPHGIFELTAIFISLHLGFSIFFSLIKLDFLIKEKFSDVLKLSIIIFIFVIIPLLVISALIEVYITPYLIDLSGINIRIFD